MCFLRRAKRNLYFLHHPLSSCCLEMNLELLSTMRENNHKFNAFHKFNEFRALSSEHFTSKLLFLISIAWGAQCRQKGRAAYWKQHDVSWWWDQTKTPIHDSPCHWLPGPVSPDCPCNGACGVWEHRKLLTWVVCTRFPSWAVDQYTEGIQPSQAKLPLQRHSEYCLPHPQTTNCNIFIIFLLEAFHVLWIVLLIQDLELIWGQDRFY